MPKFKYSKFTANKFGQVKQEWFLASSSEKDPDYYGIAHYRTEGPAVIDFDGTQIYYLNGSIGRLEGPAVIHPNGVLEYWNNGKISRKDGPAILYQDGGTDWLINGEYNSSDGPAIEMASGQKEYFYKGKKIEASTDKEFMKKIKFINLMF